MLFWLSETGKIWGFQAFWLCSVDFIHYGDPLAEICHIWGFWALSGEHMGVNAEGRWRHISDALRRVLSCCTMCWIRGANIAFLDNICHLELYKFQKLVSQYGFFPNKCSFQTQYQLNKFKNSWWHPFLLILLSYILSNGYLFHQLKRKK